MIHLSGTPSTRTINQWSYSRYGTYAKCPLRAKFKVLDRLPDPSGPAAERGNVIHALAEAYVQDNLGATPCPPELIKFGPQLAALRQHYPLLEHKVGLTKAWEECEFFAPNVWGRFILDVLYYHEPTTTAHIRDHKTGKVYPEPHLEQLELYSAVALVLFPNATHAVSEDWYLDIGPSATLTHTLTRAQLPAIQAKWTERIAVMEQDTTFAARPTLQNCKYCPYSKGKGGPCKFG